MRALILIAAAGLVASCSQTPVPPGSDAADELAGRVAGPPQTCITTYPAQNVHALDPQTLAYGYGRTIYVNHLLAACPGMRPLNTIIVHAATGNQYCRGDRVSVLEPGAIIPGPQCNLQDWVPYRRP